MKPMKKRSLWIIVSIVALVLAVAAVCLIIFGHRDGTGTKTGTDDAPEKNQYAVTFYSNDGTILKIDSVEEGKSTNPPSQPQMLYGTVFKSWDADISSVTKKQDVYPICEDVKGKANVIAVEGAYGKVGEEIFVPVRLCGEVCVSAFDMTISYDSKALELESVSGDGAILYNEKVPGKIKLNYVSTENTVADVDICLLKFSVKSTSENTSISLEMHSIYACRDSLESKNDELYVPEYSLINGTVHVLPKGD